MYAASSYWCVRPEATSVCGLKLLGHEAHSLSCLESCLDITDARVNRELLRASAYVLYSLYCMLYSHSHSIVLTLLYALPLFLPAHTDGRASGYSLGELLIASAENSGCCLCYLLATSSLTRNTLERDHQSRIY